MIEVAFTLSNEGARAARKEIREFLDYCTEKMAGDLPEKYNDETAALGYVIGEKILRAIDEAVAASEKRARAKKAPKRKWTVRERRNRQYGG